MPKLPDVGLSNPGSPQPTGGVATYGTPNSRGVVGQTLVSAGRDMEQASQIIAATNERQDEIVARDAANKLTVAGLDLKSAWSKEKGEAATKPDFVEKNMKE